MRKTLTFILLCAGVVFGQSGVYNVPFKPQLKICIPHVDAPLVLVATNGTVSANPYRNLKFCDFVLKAIDQTGTLTGTNEFGAPSPILYMYSSVTNAPHPMADFEPAVFYQDASQGWPTNAMRKLVHAQEWLSGITTNLKDSAWYSANVTSSYPETMHVISFEAFFSYVDEAYNTPLYEYIDEFDRTREYYFNGTNWVANGLVIGTNFMDGVWAKPATNDYYTTEYWEQGGPVQTVSSNNAVAIEVYPNRQAKYARWMKAGNKDVKWMVALCNGIDFYRDAAGNIIWFNVEEQWVDRVPAEGIWN